MADQAHKGRRRRWLRRSIPIVAVVLVVTVGSVAYAASGNSGTSYVTATVRRADVQQILQLSGPVTQVKQVDASFAVSGRVTSVGVALGQSVTAGQQLAQIDPTSLQYALLLDQAALAQAQATLADDESGTSSATSGTGTASSYATATTTAYITSAARGAGGGQAGSGQLAAAQKAVTDAQHKLAQDTATASSAVMAAVTACATSTPTPTPTPTPSTTPTGTPTPTPSASDSAGIHTTAAMSSGLTCQAALAAVQQAQNAVTADNQALTAATNRLVQVAGTAASTGSGSGSGGSGSGGSGGTGASGTGKASGGSYASGSRSGSSSTSGSGSGGSSSGQSSASRIATDTAAVTTAQVAVNDATRNLAGAVLTTPIAGTVAAVGITAGANESPSDSITIVASGAARVTVDVPLATIPQVKVGQVANVTPAGSSVPLAGSVESIGLLPASTSPATYPVAVLVPNADMKLMATGSTADVGIVLGTVNNALTVPNSAVTRISSTLATVTVVKGTSATRTRVTLGVTGTWSTQVLSGLSVGQRVMLANSSVALPSNSSTSTRAFGTGGGATFRGGAGGGGFGGARAGG